MFLSEVSMQGTHQSVVRYKKHDDVLDQERYDIRDTVKGTDPYRYIKKAVSELKCPVYFGTQEKPGESWELYPNRYDLDRAGAARDAAALYCKTTPGVRVFESYPNQGIFIVVVHSQDAMPGTVFKFEIGGVREGKTKAIPYNRVQIVSFPEVLDTAHRLLMNPAAKGVGAITIDYRRWKKLIMAIVQYHSLRQQVVQKLEKDNV